MKQEQRAEMAEHLEKTTQDIFDAVDRRDFDINSPVWSNLADDFLIEVEHLDKPQKQMKGTYLYYLKDLMTENPDMRMKITSMETKISDNAATAETFSSIETTGMARMPDVKRDTLAIYTWKKTNGRWLLVKTKSLSGGLEY